MRIPLLPAASDLTIGIAAGRAPLDAVVEALSDTHGDLVSTEYSPSQNSVDVSPALQATAALSAYAYDIVDDPDVWWLAMPPVSLAADMRDVRLGTWPVRNLSLDSSLARLREIAGFLAGDEDPRVREWHLSAPAPTEWLASAPASAALDFSMPAPITCVGEVLRDVVPVGPDAGKISRLTTELQMLLHTRASATDSGFRSGDPMNGVWLHGAGILPAPRQQHLPALVSDLACLCGWWRLCGQTGCGLTANIDLASAPAGAFLVPAVWQPVVHQAVASLMDRRHKRVLLITGDGGVVLHRRRWWQRRKRVQG